MATRTASAAVAGRSPRAMPSGSIPVHSSYSFNAGSASAGDVIPMLKVPAGATVTDIIVGGGSGAMTITVGDGNDTDRYITALSASAALAPTRMNAIAGMQYQYTADDTIDIVVTAVTTGTATSTIYLTALYTMDK